MLTAFVPEAWTDRLLGCRQLVVRDLYTATTEWPARTCFIEKNAFAVAAAADGADRQTPGFPQSRIYSANTTPAKTNCANWLRAMARNTAFTYRNNQPDAKQVGRELGVRYILEGSLRKAGNRIRLTAQLIEAASGTHVWAERYDRALDDIFAVQDEITLSVVGAIEPSLRRAEIERAKRKRPDSLDAYDLYLRALPHLHSSMPGGADKGLAILRQALALQPDYPDAHAAAAWCHEVRYMRGGLQEADREAALEHARAAIEAGADDAETLAVAGFAIGLVAHD
jgi:hypothetical protein